VTTEATGSVILTADSANRLWANGVAINTAVGTFTNAQMLAAGFTAVAAESIAGQNLLVWRHTSGYLHLWRMDAAWNPTSGFGSQVPGSQDHVATESAFGVSAHHNHP